MKPVLRAIACLMMAAQSSFISMSAHAQEFPSRQIRIVLTSGVGTAGDVVMRVFAQKFNERTGWTSLVENRPGGDNIIAAQTVLLAPPDGHTILAGSGTLTMLPATKKNVPFDLLRDFRPVAQIFLLPIMLAVHPSVPATSLSELVAYSKANPGKLNVAGFGTGTTTHLTFELLKRITGINAVYVAYQNGTGQRTDLLGGIVQAGISSVPEYAESVKAGKLRAIMAFSRSPSPAIPGMATIQQAAGSNELDVSSWTGLLVRTGTPRSISDRLERESLSTGQTPEVQDAIQKFMLIQAVEPSDKFGERLETDTARWAKVVRDANLKFD